jgi:predicted small lipoprotein YifL
MLREFSAHPRIVASALVAALLTLSLGACGIKGPLKLPPPAPTQEGGAGTAASPAAPDKERAP